jgi:hypothetical protein
MQLIKDGKLGSSINAVTMVCEPLMLVDLMLQTNRHTTTLEPFRELARNGHAHLELKGELLLYQGRLFVPEDDQLRTKLLNEIHATLPAAHPGRNKTRKIAARQFYWPRMNADIDLYIAACQSCRRASTPRDKTLGCSNHCLSRTDPGSTSQWISCHLTRTSMVMTTSL